MYFLNTHTYISTTNRLNFIPQILYSTIVSDTANWTLISGMYIATGGEQYIIIGNFNTNATTDTLPLNGSNISYYYIDDVSVMDCTGVGVEDVTAANEINIYPNPFSSQTTITFSEDEWHSIKIVNVLGCEILKQVQNDKSATIDMSGYAKGIYFVQVQTDGSTGSPQGKIIRKKIIKQ